MKLTETQILEILQSPRNADNLKIWRNKHATLDIYMNGGDVASELEKVKNYENQNQLELRENVARSTKDTLSYILNPLNKIYSATGFNQDLKIANETQKEEFAQHLQKLPEGMSLRNWMKIYWLEAFIVDPNAVILVEYKEGKAYPTYKSILVVHDYLLKWNSFEYLVLKYKEATVVINDKPEKKQIYRVYDEAHDGLYYVNENKLYKYGNQTEDDFEFDEQHAYTNKLGMVPAHLPSNLIDKKTNGKKSFIDIIDETLREYMRDSSVHSIYKFLHGFPIFWAYAAKCVRCSGTTRVKNSTWKDGDDVSKKFVVCPSCDGDGLQKTKDVSDGVRLGIPTSEDPKLAPDIAGYVTPDLETWGKQTEEMAEMRKEMFYAVWGTYVSDSTGVEKTATEAYINSQPIMDKLHPIADLGEEIESWIIDMMAKIMYSKKDTGSVRYGRRWLIETPDILWNRYTQAKKDQAPITTLDYMYSQFLAAEYHNDSEMLDRKIKEFSIEPYAHYSLVDLKDIASPKQLQRKLLFSEWAVELDKREFAKPIKELRNLFNTYVTANSDIVEPEKVVVPQV